MKKLRLRTYAGLLLALLAFVLMCVCAVSCGNYIKDNVKITDSQSGEQTPVEPSSGDETTASPETTTAEKTTTSQEETTTSKPETTTEGVGTTAATEPVTTEASTTASVTTTPITTEAATTEPVTTEAVTTTPVVTTEAVTTVPVTTAPITTEAVTTVPVTTNPVINPEEPRKVTNFEDMKAMWISQFDMNNVYTQDKKQRSEASYRKLVEKILDNVKKDGINTVIYQIRPNADSMYPSEYYPMSKYVVGAYGREAEYDPVAIFLELAHERGFSVQAWINPMRGMTKTEIASVSNKFAIKKWYSASDATKNYVPVSGSNVYLDPGYEEVRNLIVNGAKEILTKYNFDGLHMDDYFYPTQAETFDSASYAIYKQNGGTKSLANYRKENLNKLVSALYAMTKSVDKNLIFGISPAGNIDTVRSKQYADVDTWCGKEGYIDYICPQVYFGLEHGSWDFVKTSQKWQAIIKVDSVDLIIGMTLGKAVNGYDGTGDTYAGTGKNEWINNKDVLKRCLEKTKDFAKCRGVSYFCYQYFYDPVNGKANAKTATERANFLPVLADITWKK